MEWVERGGGGSTWGSGARVGLVVALLGMVMAPRPAAADGRRGSRVTRLRAATASAAKGARPQLGELTVSGPAAVDESSTAAYVATARYADGSSRVVTAAARWSVAGDGVTLATGTLTVGAITGDRTVVVTASYTERRVTRAASLTVLVRDTVPEPVSGSHAGFFSSYEGTRTCLGCHEEQARELHGSVHYQWRGDPGGVAGATGTVGKLGAINDFCIYADIDWLGKLTNVRGEQVDGGCARCHVGLGARPAPEPTPAQLENLDCLVCHAADYRRQVDLVDGAWRMVPNLAAMSVSLLQAASDLTRPGDAQCLSCHARSGGGDNYKRGDLEAAHAVATPDLDVHSAAGVTCVDCHSAGNHRVTGRGVDLWPTDAPGTVACQSCHGAAPHDSSRLNGHLAKVACQSCHVPEYAKSAPTDMERDWSRPGVLLANGLYEPHIRFGELETPAYRFWNGRSSLYRFGDAATPGPSGRVNMAEPLGDVNDPAAKLYPFKRHLGNQPQDPTTGVLLPLKIGIFFATGDVNTAVERGATEVFGAYAGHTFAPTETWMGLFHEVTPKEQALGCADCHGGGRVDFTALGYEPRATRDGQPLCTSCHGDKSGAWPAAERFTKVHEKHVDGKHLACSQCHTITR